MTLHVGLNINIFPEKLDIMRGVNQDTIETPGIEENKRRCYGEARYLLGPPDIELDGDICKQSWEGNWCVSICLIDPIKILCHHPGTHALPPIKYHMTYDCCYAIKYAVIPGTRQVEGMTCAFKSNLQQCKGERYDVIYVV